MTMVSVTYSFADQETLYIISHNSKNFDFFRYYFFFNCITLYYYNAGIFFFHRLLSRYIIPQLDTPPTCIGNIE
jgi:hypothetical protein